MSSSIDTVDFSSVADWDRYSTQARETNGKLESFLRSLSYVNEPKNKIMDLPVDWVLPIQRNDSDGFDSISVPALRALLDATSIPGLSTNDEVVNSFQDLVNASIPYHLSLSVAANKSSYMGNLPSKLGPSDLVSAGTWGIPTLAGAGYAMSDFISVIYRNGATPGLDDIVPAVIGGLLVGGIIGFCSGGLLSWINDKATRAWRTAKKKDSYEAALNDITHGARSNEYEFQSALNKFCDLTQDLPSAEHITIKKGINSDLVDRVPALYDRFSNTAIAAQEVLGKKYEFRLPEYEHVDQILLGAREEVAAYLAEGEE